MKKFLLLLCSIALFSCVAEDLKLSAAEVEFIKKNDFDISLVKELKKAIGSDFIQSEAEVYYETKDGKFDSKIVQNPGVVFELDQDKVDVIFMNFFDKAKSKGYFLYRSEQNFGYEKDSITLLKSNDQFDIIRAAQTDGINYDIDNKAVLAKLIEWDSKYHFEIIGASLDWMEARFINKPADFLAFAKEVYEFCPDVVDQGTNTVEALAEEMERTNTLYLWWD